MGRQTAARGHAGLLERLNPLARWIVMVESELDTGLGAGWERRASSAGLVSRAG